MKQCSGIVVVRKHEPEVVGVDSKSDNLSSSALASS
jgi:hypothetical protein